MKMESGKKMAKGLYDEFDEKDVARIVSLVERADEVLAKEEQPKELTVRDLLEKVPEKCWDWKLAVAKHDKEQLRCSTTVFVEKVQLGFDWTHGQVVLEPKVRLVTDPEVIEKRRIEALREYAGRTTNALRVATEISRMIEEIADEGLKKRLLEKLKEI